MSNISKKMTYYWLPVILWACLIFVFSAIPGVTIGFPDPLEFVLRKTAHMLEYLILAWLIMRALVKGHQMRITQTAILMLLILCFFYATLDELHQTLVPFRQGLATDVGFDALGAFLGIRLFMHNLKRPKNKHSKK